MKRSGFKKPRKPLNRGTKQLKRSWLKRGKKRLKSKPYVRTKEQEEYHDAHPKCEVPKCRKNAMPTPHHVDSHLSRADIKSNLFSVCWWHHIGPLGPHVIGIKEFCEKFGLTKHPKWEAVYSRVEWRGIGHG